MKTVSGDTRPLGRGSPADPFLPTGAEALRLPSDFVIGQIGSDGVDQRAYGFAVDFLSAMTKADDVSKLYSERGRQDSSAVSLQLEQISPVSVRVGSGVSGGDGASFLVRFVGKERSSAGELHLIRSGSSWLVDALILDDPVDDFGENGTARFDPFTYTRFL